MKWEIKAALCLLVLGLLALPGGGVEAYEHDGSPRISCSRGWVTLSLYASGSVGGYNVGSGMTGEPDMFHYPGWNALPSHNAHSNYTRRNGCAIGFGTWIVSREGADYKISWTGPRSKSEDIVDLMYDPSQGPEANLGVTTQWEQGRSGSFAPSSNYWPGALIPDAGPPRKIWNFSPGNYTPDTKFPEEIVISKWLAGKHGLTLTRKAYTWSHQDFDDFIIMELEIENTGDVTREDIYVPLLVTWSVSEFGERMISTRWWSIHDNSRDDWFKYTDAGNYTDGSPGGPIYISASQAKGLKLSYQFDGNSPFTGYDDTGEPWNKDLEASGLREMAVPNGMMTSFQFVGMAPIAYADNAGIHSFNLNDQGKYVQPEGEQPAYVNWWEIRGVNDFDEPTPEGDTPAAIFGALTATPVADNPTENGLFTNVQVYGPYTLAPGEKAKIVYAYVAGMGAEYGGPGGEPMDPWQWALTATKDDLAKGEQAIVENLEHALFAYQSGYDIPDAPPDVDVVIKSDENARVKLLWSAEADGAVNPDYGEADIAGYRIYRGLRGTLTAVGPYTVVADIPVGGPYPAGVTFDPNATWPEDAAEGDQALRETLALDADQGRRASRPGMYSWSDPNSNAGFSYWYSIRAYARGHDTWQNADGTKTFADLPARVQKHLKVGLEGGYSHILQVGQGSPVLPFVAAVDRFERPVTVVPNPYFADGTHEYGGGIKIRFVNVPSKAYVYIFNTAGQLVQVLRKTNETRSEISWNGRPYSTIRAPVGPGIYFYVVQSRSDASLDKVQTGTFVVVR